MVNVRAFRSGNWSDIDPATSPWGSGGSLYAPASGDIVYSNAYIVQVDQDVSVSTLTNASASSRLWKDGATTTGTVGGTFNLQNGVTVHANIVAGTTSNSCVILSGSSSATIYGNTSDSATDLVAGCYSITFSSSGVLTYVGNITGRATNVTGVYSLYHSGPGKLVMTGDAIGKPNFNNSYGTAIYVTPNGGELYLTGNVYGGSGGTSVLSRGILTYGDINIITGNVLGGTLTGEGINNGGKGTLIVVGNSTGGISAPAINNSSTGTAIILGNVIASTTKNAFVSSNASAINRITGNIINDPNGTAAIYAVSYRVDPVPTNSYIRYSNVDMFTTDSLSAFSMPPVSAVRFGVSFANNTLVGTCNIPSPNSVNIGVPVDNTIGTAILTPSTLFDVSMSSLTASDSLGSRLKNSSTIESIGNILASFSN